MSDSFLSTRVDRSAAPLLVGDVIAIVAVIAIGMRFGHGTLTGPAALAETAWPFLVGWAIASVPIGAYSAGAAESAKAAVPLAIRSWVPAAVVGVFLRGLLQTSLDQGLLIFLAIMLVTGGVALAGWRWVAFKLR
ncbi:MAG: DUF3054 domain-containing protein [Halolamina sp.]